MHSKLSKLTVAALSFLLTACVTNSESILEQGESSPRITADFKSGTLRMNCSSIGCAASMGGNQRRMRDLLNEEKWLDLVILVENKGDSSDLSYYYLGRAAEELGFSDSAKIYYREALGSRVKCGGAFIDNCVGFRFPTDINEGLARIENKNRKQRGEAVYDRRVYEVRDNMTEVFDEYKKVTNFKAPVVVEKKYCPVLIRAWRDEKDKTTEYQAYVSDSSYGEWRHYSEAYDIDGNKLNFNHIQKNVGECLKDLGCRTTEDVGVSFRREYLVSRAEKGMSFKISGKNGSLTCSVPAYYIQGVLLAIPSDPKDVGRDSAIVANKPAEGRLLSNSEGYERDADRFIVECGKVAASTNDQSSIEECVSKAQRQLSESYNKLNAGLQSKKAKAALQKHYLAVVVSLKGVGPLVGEGESRRANRQANNKQKADEAWGLFQLSK